MSFGIGIGDFLAVLKLAQSVRGKWIDAPPEYTSIKNEIKNVENVLRDINELENQIELTPRETQTLYEATASCVPVLEICNQIVQKYVAVADPGSGSRTRVRRSWKRFKLDPEDIRHARDQLSSLVTQLTAIEATIQIRVTSDMQEAVEDLQQSDDQRERERIADWYAPASFAIQRNEYSRARQGGTGAWFLQDDRYLCWRDVRNRMSCSTLLCPGIPGSGKTMMATAIIDDLHALLENEENCVLAYFYCNFNRREQQELHHIYSSIVRQLFQEQLSVPAEVKDLFLKHRDKQTRPSTDELKTLLRLLAQRHRRVYIVIDALDECNIDKLTREQLMYELFGIQKDYGNVNLLMTTRFIPEIMQNFTTCEQIEVRAAKEDIERYLDKRMGELASFVRRKVDLQQEIRLQIVALVDGMFLLARLHFEALLGYTNATKLREALRSLPSGKDALDRAYDTARERIDRQPKPQADLARHVLTWIAYSKRELSMDELREAVAMSMTAERTDIDHENDLDEPDEMVSVCAGLVVLDGATGVIRLVHYTTQRYIDNVQDQWLPKAQADIATSCLAYLSLEPFRLKEIEWYINLTGYFQRYKLLLYVGQHWGEHVRESDNTDLQDKVVQLMGDRTWMCFTSQIAVFCEHSFSLTVTWHKHGMSPLHICVHYDMAAVCSRLLEGGEDCNQTDSRGWTPVLWAAENNKIKTLRVLLEWPGVDVNMQDRRGCTALSIAIQYGQETMVELLLCQPGIDINRQDPHGKTALSIAVWFGRDDIVKLLLCQPGIDINRQDTIGKTPLNIAVLLGQDKTVELLLYQPGIDINRQDNDGATALSIAVRFRQDKKVVELLLRQPGIDVDTKDKEGKSALEWALEEGHKEIATLLQAFSTDADKCREHSHANQD